jgi:hypothetical protein
MKTIAAMLKSATAAYSLSTGGRRRNATTRVM